MTPDVIASPPWGRGDFYTLATGLPLGFVACYVHRRALRARGAECQEMLLSILSNALSLPPLVMILLDPFVRRVSGFDLFGVVVSEARLGLWFACLLATINGTIGLFKERRDSP